VWNEEESIIYYLQLCAANIVFRYLKSHARDLFWATAVFSVTAWVTDFSPYCILYLLRFFTGYKEEEASEWMMDLNHHRVYAEDGENWELMLWKITLSMKFHHDVVSRNSITSLLCCEFNEKLSASSDRLLNFILLRYFRTASTLPHYTTSLHYLITPPHYTTSLHYLITLPHYTTSLHYLITLPHYTTSLHYLITLPHYTSSFHFLSPSVEWG
jgi:hypothetical protein